MTLYPDVAPSRTSFQDSFFSAVPRVVNRLVGEGILERRDVALVNELLTYKNAKTTKVFPRLDTLAARLACSIDTVQRSLRRLVDAGLVVKERLRDARGRLGQCVYDLSALLMHLTSHTANVRPGPRPVRHPAKPVHSAQIKAAIAQPTLPSATATIPQNCGDSEAERSDVEAHSAREAVTNPIVGELIRLGVLARVAHVLVARFGEARCRAQLSDLPKRRRIKDTAAYIVSAIFHGYASPGSPASALPAPSVYVQRPTRPASPPAHDPLDDLPPAEYDAMAAKARAVLIDETRDPVRRSLQNGGGQPLIRRRMRQLMTTPATTSPA